MTQEEAEMAQTELLKIAHNVKECVKEVEDKVNIVIDGTQALFIWFPSLF